MESTIAITPDIDVLPTFFRIPGLGLLPVNAFLIKGKEPVLVDTGAALDDGGADATEGFMHALRSLIDPAELRWIWLTHADSDHIGSINRILEEAPNARVVTTFLTVGRMTTVNPLPMDRVYLLNPGQSLDIGDRMLTSLRPPSFDAADTAGLFDSKTKTLFSSDCFGAVLPDLALEAGDIAAADLRAGQLLWATVDAPWLHSVNPAHFETSLEAIRRLEPELVLSSHLPPARGMVKTLLETLASAPASTPFVGPDQAALMAMMAQLQGEAAVA